MSGVQNILVAGANRPLGARIALGLADAGHIVTATRRVPDAHWDAALTDAGVRLDALDLNDVHALAKLAEELDAAVLTPILSISGRAARVLAAAGVQRGVVFSSNNVAIVGEDPVYDELRAEEAALMDVAPDWAILRPTMIYGYPDDGNLSRLLRVLARAPVFPALGKGRAVQQPIHVHDLARIAVGLLSGAWDEAGKLAVGGPDALTHRAMIDLSRRVSGGKGKLLPVPLGPAKGLVSLLTRAGVRLPVSPAQLARVDLDKAARNPAEIPQDLLPQISLEDGLRGLASEMGLKP